MTNLTPELRKRIGEVDWYHTIDLTPGLTTPGWFDTRPSTSIVPMPASLEGKRCLDVGTWDGFWAFEMEKRGAASVTAIDIDDPDRWDWPPHGRLGAQKQETAKMVLEAFKRQATGYHLAHEAMGSSVERLDMSVYELSPETVGQFDFVFLGSLLLHLRDPVLALDRLRSVCSGEAVIADTVDYVTSKLRPRTPTMRLEGQERPWWWLPNIAGLHRMVESAGFEMLDRTGMYFIPLGQKHPKPNYRNWHRELRNVTGRERIISSLRGLPHAAVRARPLT